MTTESMRIAIATACGWSDIAQGPYDGSPFGRHETHQLLPLPDYLNDLNAMHEAEKCKAIRAQSLAFYVANLEFIVHRDAKTCCDVGSIVITRGCIFATAAQRAEAFLRTLGKYIES